MFHNQLNGFVPLLGHLHSPLKMIEETLVSKELPTSLLTASPKLTRKVPKRASILHSCSSLPF